MIKWRGIEEITPTRAAELLKHNTSNRKMRLAKVRTYAILMKNGMWKADSNDAILISENGDVLNGQHRLQAVIEAGIPVAMEVRYGADKDIYKVLDQGANRSVGDYMDEFPYKFSITACARTMASVKRGETLTVALHGQIAGNAAVPNDWVIEEINTNFDLYQRVAQSAYKFRNTVQYLQTSAFMAAVMVAIYVGKGNEVFEFLEDLTSPAPVSNSATLLRDHIMRRKLSGKRTTKKDTTALVLLAYEKYLSGDSVNVMRSDAAMRVFAEYEMMLRMKFEERNGGDYK